MNFVINLIGTYKEDHNSYCYVHHGGMKKYRIPEGSSKVSLLFNRSRLFAYDSNFYHRVVCCWIYQCSYQNRLNMK